MLPDTAKQDCSKPMVNERLWSVQQQKNETAGKATTSVWSWGWIILAMTKPGCSVGSFMHFEVFWASTETSIKFLNKVGPFPSAPFLNFCFCCHGHPQHNDTKDAVQTIDCNMFKSVRPKMCKVMESESL